MAQNCERTADFNGTVGNANFGNFAFNGSFSGNAYADFMLGLPLSSTRLNPLINRRLSQKELGLFITDTFKLTPKLTLDYGLRWDRFSATTYEDGLMYNWDPKTGNRHRAAEGHVKDQPVLPHEHQHRRRRSGAGARSGQFRATHRRCLPLNDKTVIRGGYGIFNEFLGQFCSSAGRRTIRSQRDVLQQHRQWRAAVSDAQSISLRRRLSATFLPRKSMAIRCTPRTG